MVMVISKLCAFFDPLSSFPSSLHLLGSLASMESAQPTGNKAVHAHLLHELVSLVLLRFHGSGLLPLCVFMVLASGPSAFSWLWSYPSFVPSLFLCLLSLPLGLSTDPLTNQKQH
jgi:hypothetical protein